MVIEYNASSCSQRCNRDCYVGDRTRLRGWVLIIIVAWKRSLVTSKHRLHAYLRFNASLSELSLALMRHFHGYMSIVFPPLLFMFLKAPSV